MQMVCFKLGLLIITLYYEVHWVLETKNKTCLEKNTLWGKLKIYIKPLSMSWVISQSSEVQIWQFLNKNGTKKEQVIKLACHC